MGCCENVFRREDGQVLRCFRLYTKEERDTKNKYKTVGGGLHEGCVGQTGCIFSSEVECWY